MAVVRLVLSLFLLFTASVALAGHGNMPDPNVTEDITASDPVCNTSWSCNAPYADVNGRGPCPINPSGIRIVLITAGQSIGETEGDQPVAMAHPSQVCNFSYLDGQLYVRGLPAPALGTSRSSILPNGQQPTGYQGDLVCDTLITNNPAISQCIEVPLSIGGSRIQFWADNGPLRNIPCVAMQRLAVIGLTPVTPNTFWIFRWKQGTSDRQGPSQVGTTQADYTMWANQIFARLQGCGFTGSNTAITIDRESWGSMDIWPPVDAAQVALGAAFHPGSNSNIIPNSCRLDGIHLNSACGIPQDAAMYIAALHAIGAPF